jgi:hypothetical protein
LECTFSTQPSANHSFYDWLQWLLQQDINIIGQRIASK